jgi:hypothetical protein
MTGIMRHPPSGIPTKTEQYRMKGDLVIVNAVRETMAVVIPNSSDLLTPILSMENPTSSPQIEVKLPMMPYTTPASVSVSFQIETG